MLNTRMSFLWGWLDIQSLEEASNHDSFQKMPSCLVFSATLLCFLHDNLIDDRLAGSKLIG